MTRAQVCTALWLACPAAAHAAPVPQVISVTLPDGDAPYPGGAAAEVMNNNCLACHSSEMVLNQPRLAQAAWAAEVAKMRGVYKAPINDADVPKILAYLAMLPVK